MASTAASPKFFQPYYDGPKPTLRGQLHHAGFYLFVFLGTFFLLKARNFTAQWSFFIYFASTILVYGISATFHVFPWRTKQMYNIMRKLDHSTIFLLIAGTYTPICASCLGLEINWVFNLLVIAWIIAACGIIKSVLWTDPPKVITVMFYFISGLTIVPFLPRVFGTLPMSQTIMYVVGGAIYLAGGLIYGIEKPDPIPNHFGYHEVFHTCTILANFCFFFSIIQCI